MNILDSPDPLRQLIAAIQIAADGQGLFSPQVQEVVDMEQLASRHGLQGYYDADTWIPFYTLQASVPITTYNENLYLRQNTSIVLSDDSLTYFVRILDYKVSDDISPIDLQKQAIRSIIVNRRKVDLLAKMQADLMAEAEKADEVKIY